jgi:hypothetical protein
MSRIFKDGDVSQVTLAKNGDVILYRIGASQPIVVTVEERLKTAFNTRNAFT